jgi:CHASE2 domain-containing sensor protein/tRNA A-37 threonylcarbamoyl transferase component Bud32
VNLPKLEVWFTIGSNVSARPRLGQQRSSLVLSMVPSPQQQRLMPYFAAGIAAAIATVGVVGLQALTLLEPLELRVYDQWLRWRPATASADRMLIVAIGEEDIQALKQYPVPDEVLIQAVAELQKHRPKVIGIDIFRDFPVPDRFRPSTQTLPSLGRAMMTQPNTVIVCKVGQGAEPDIAPPAGLLPNQIGFADIPVDSDGVVRRAILATTPEAKARCHTPQSFALALASIFLGTAPQRRGKDGLALGTARFQALTPNWGGYSNLDAAGFQILINYGTSPRTYKTVSLTDVLSERVLPSQVRDRAVLIGVTGSSSNDKLLTPLSQPEQGNRFTAGVVVQAAILDDLLAAALDNRPPLWTWPQGAIALWIFGWSLVGALITLKGQRWLVLPLFVTAGVGLGGLTFLLFLQSGWIPLVAPELGFVSAGVLMLAYRALAVSPSQRSRSPSTAEPIPVTPFALVNDRPSTAPQALSEAAADSLLMEDKNTDVAPDANATVVQPDTCIPFTPVPQAAETTVNPDLTAAEPASRETLLTPVVDEVPITEIPSAAGTATNPTEMETFLVVEPTDPESVPTAIQDVIPETQLTLDPSDTALTAASKLTAATSTTPLETQLELPEHPVSDPSAAELPETQVSLPEPLPPTSAPTTTRWFTEVPDTQVVVPEEGSAVSTDVAVDSSSSDLLSPTLVSEVAVNLDPDAVDTQLGVVATPATLEPVAAPDTTDTLAPPSTCPSPVPKTTVVTDIEAAATESLPHILGGRYQVLSQLGEGGFGRTFLAADQHLPDHPICVIKQLVPSRKDERFLAIARRLFQREAKALAQLGQHPRIPRLLAYFEEEGVFYLTQEYVEGESLKEEFEKKLTLSQAEAIAILRSILELLEYVHQLGVIHRDIKPANIMRRRSDQQLFLIDFGAVRHVQPEDLQKHGKYTISIGTRGYAPSEQMAGRPVIASDLYSLGMVIIQGLTGLAPMDLPNDPTTGDVVWEPGTHLAPAFVAILNRMVRYNFRDRYQSAAEVLAALAAAGL